MSVELQKEANEFLALRVPDLLFHDSRLQRFVYYDANSQEQQFIRAYAQEGTLNLSAQDEEDLSICLEKVQQFSERTTRYEAEYFDMCAQLLASIQKEFR